MEIFKKISEIPLNLYSVEKNFHSIIMNVFENVYEHFILLFEKTREKHLLSIQI